MGPFIPVFPKLPTTLSWHIRQLLSFNLYHPLMKLREGNVFSCVCPWVRLSVCHKVSHVSIRSNSDALDSSLQTSTGHQTWDPPTPLLVTFGGEHWRPLQICSFNDPLPATCGGGHWNWSAISWQLGGTHPTGMISFLCYVYRSYS